MQIAVANPSALRLNEIQPAAFRTIPILPLRWLCILVVGICVLAARPATAREWERWSFPDTQFDLAVFRVPLSLSLLGLENTGPFRYVSGETALSLSLVRENEALASIQIEAKRRTSKDRGLIEWAGLSAGYGQIAALETAAARGNNAAVWNPIGAVYVKTSFTF